MNNLTLVSNHRLKRKLFHALERRRNCSREFDRGHYDGVISTICDLAGGLLSSVWFDEWNAANPTPETTKDPS